MLVQIYEIQTPREAEQCLALGVDRIGSVLLSLKDWRQPVLREVVRLSRGTPATNSLIPLFQDQDTLCRAVDYYQPHCLHFCESLTDPLGRPADLGGVIRLQEGLKERFPNLTLVRSIPLPQKGVARDFPFLALAEALAPVSDLFLIDTWLGQEPVEGFVGITGRTCDWERGRHLVRTAGIPVILAGGLDPENVYDAVRAVTPAGVDSCTGTNSTDGKGNPVRFKKDFQKVAAFLKHARRAEEAIRDRLLALRAKEEKLREDLKDREAALPAHSIRPRQIKIIEDLEEEIGRLERERRLVERALGNTGAV